MPKLLQINVSANWGSHGRIAEEIGEKAITQGWESYIAYGRYVNESQLKLIPIGTKRDVYNHVAISRLGDRHGLASVGATKRFLEEVNSISPDVIHLHNIHGYYINYEILFDFLKEYDKPVVWTLHDCWSFTGHCAFPMFANCEKWETHCEAPCPQRKSYPASWIVDNCWQNFEKKKCVFTSLKKLNLVTVSKWLENETRKSFLREISVGCIYNGVNIELFKPEIDTTEVRQRHGIKRDDKVILGVASRWEARKGLSDLLKLRSILPPNYKMILIGVKERQIKDLPNGIEGIERTDSQRQLASYYSMANVYVNPSYAETFGMTTAEAMACGTPSVVYGVTASPEVIDENTGLKVNAGNIDGLACAVIKICEQEKEKYSKACRDRATKYFNKEDCYNKYIRLYNDLIMGGGFYNLRSIRVRSLRMRSERRAA